MAGLGQRTGRRRSEELQGAGGAGGWSEQRSGVPERGPFCPQPRHWLGQRPSRGCTASLGWGLGRTALAGAFPELGPGDLPAAFVGTVGQTQESGVPNQLGVVSEGQTDPRAGLRDGRSAGSFLLGPGGPPTPCGHCSSWARGPVPRPCPCPHVAAPRVRVCAARRGQGHRPQGDLVFPSYSCNRPASKQVARESQGWIPRCVFWGSRSSRHPGRVWELWPSIFLRVAGLDICRSRGQSVANFLGRFSFYPLSVTTASSDRQGHFGNSWAPRNGLVAEGPPRGLEPSVPVTSPLALGEAPGGFICRSPDRLTRADQPWPALGLGDAAAGRRVHGRFARLPLVIRVGVLLHVDMVSR